MKKDKKGGNERVQRTELKAQSHREKRRGVKMRVEQKTTIGDGRKRARRDQNRGRGLEKDILECKGRKQLETGPSTHMENYY